jgi:hypothetical protein
VQPNMDPEWDINTPEGMANARKWTLWLVSSIHDGGMWVVPRSKSTYKIYHRPRVAIKVSGEPEPSIQRVFRAIGWEVIDIT